MSDQEDLLDAIALPKLSPGGRGRAATPLSYEIVREVTPADIAALAQGIDAGVADIQTITARHHQLARLLADGLTNEASSRATGYTPARISSMRSDPAFKELIAYYVTQKEGAYLDVHERLAVMGATAGEILQDRMETDPEQFANKELVQVMEAAFDRSVAPSKGVKGAQHNNGPGGNTAVQINVNFGKSQQGPTEDSKEKLLDPVVDVKLLESPDGS